MSHTSTAKVFKTGRSQAVRLPAAFRFDTDEVFIRRDESTGDVILSARPDNWDGFFAALDTMIAAHAKHLNLTLVSNDKAFQQVPDLEVQDWRAD